MGKCRALGKDIPECETVGWVVGDSSFHHSGAYASKLHYQKLVSGMFLYQFVGLDSYIQASQLNPHLVHSPTRRA